MFHDRVEASPVFQSILDGPYPAAGSAAFPPSSDPVLQDLYYAVHKFNWRTYDDWWVEISDHYDFDIEDLGYDSIANAAVGTMAVAQNWGVIVPYEWEMIFYYWE